MTVTTECPFAFVPLATNNGLLGGIHYAFSFENGYGASVVRHRYSYGNEAGLWELAVVRNGAIVYDTPITEDVLGHLDIEAVNEALAQVEALA